MIENGKSKDKKKEAEKEIDFHFWYLALLPRTSIPEVINTPSAEEIEENQDLLSAFNLSVTSDPHFNDTGRARLSEGISSTFEQCKGEPYVFGGKGSGGYDCSGFVEKAARAAFAHLPPAVQKQLAKAMNSNSEGQYAGLLDLGAQSREYLAGNKSILISSLHGGEVGFVDTGGRKHDKGRLRGIDHTFIVFKDDCGRLMVAESNGRQGVTYKTAEKFFHSPTYVNAKKTYIVDLNQLAQDLTLKNSPALVAQTPSPGAFKPAT